MTDTTLQQLRKQLSIHEGRKATMYQDTVGKWTIGVGHNLSDKSISERAIDIILEDDIQDAIKDCNKFQWFSKLDEVRQCVIVDMVFNMGYWTFSTFVNTINYISQGDWQNAVNNMEQSLWHKQVGQRAITLENMMLTGKFPV